MAGSLTLCIGEANSFTVTADAAVDRRFPVVRSYMRSGQHVIVNLM